MGPAPMIRILRMSVRLGTARLFSSRCDSFDVETLRPRDARRATPARQDSMGRRGPENLTILAIRGGPRQAPDRDLRGPRGSHGPPRGAGRLPVLGRPGAFGSRPKEPARQA